jgi:hypothetical protein
MAVLIKLLDLPNVPRPSQSLFASPFDGQLAHGEVRAASNGRLYQLDKGRTTPYRDPRKSKSCSGVAQGSEPRCYRSDAPTVG